MYAKNTIRNRVMAVIAERISVAQTEFDGGCKSIDEEHVRRVKYLESQRDENKNKLEEELVNSIVGKVL